MTKKSCHIEYLTNIERKPHKRKILSHLRMLAHNEDILLCSVVQWNGCNPLIYSHYEMYCIVNSGGSLVEAVPGTRPQGSRFCFNIQNFRNVTDSGVHATYEVHTPLREILDLPLVNVFILNTAEFFKCLR